MPIDGNTGIFYETQVSGLCRLHALNAFLGKSLITADMFSTYMHEYDNYLLTRFNISISSSAFDLVNSDQMTLVTYVLRKYSIHARYYTLNSIYNKPLDDTITNARFIFIYNEHHIWGIVCKDHKYYKVDNGITVITLDSLKYQKNIGLIIPVNKQKEWNFHMNTINKILETAGATCENDITTLLMEYNKTNSYLDAMEIPLGVAISILELQMPVNTEFKQLRDIVRRYTEFTQAVTKGRYHDLNLILKYIPSIVFEMSLLCR